MIVSVLIYGLAFVISCGFAKIYEKRKAKGFKKAVLLFFIVAPPVLVSGFRRGIGIDYYTYQDIYYDIKRIGISAVWGYYTEPLWNIINVISPNVRIMFLLSSAVYGIFITAAILRYKDKTGVALPLFISYMTSYGVSYNITRQAIAGAIILFALTYLNENKIKYLFWVIVAVLFHKTAIIGLLFLFLTGGKRQFVFLLICILFSPLISKIGIIILKYIVNKFGIYQGYLNKVPQVSYGFLLYISPILIFGVYCLIKQKSNDKLLFLLFEIFILQILFQFIGNEIAYVDRFAQYCSISQILLIPIFINRFKIKSLSRLWTVLIVLWYIFYFIIMFIVLNTGPMFPYIFIGGGNNAYIYNSML